MGGCGILAWNSLWIYEKPLAVISKMDGKASIKGTGNMLYELSHQSSSIEDS